MSLILSRIKKFFRRSLRPPLNEFKKLLCGIKLGEHTFVVDDFAEVKYRCRTVREVNLTANFGFEKAPLGAFLFLLRNDDVVWDIGAAFGLFSVHSAKFSQAVVAFEPDPSSSKRLLNNITINGQDSHVSVHEIAVAAGSGELELFTSGLKGTSPSLSGDGEHRSSVKVRTKSVDDIVSEGVELPSVIKIDVEGGEAGVLRGANLLLNGRNKPRVLFVEVHPRFLPSFGESSDTVEQLILDSGYRMIARERRADQYHILAVADERA